MTKIEIAWLAGLLDGEGYFYWNKDKDYYGHPRIRLGMTDRDVVERAANLMGAKSVRIYQSKSGNRRPVFVCAVAATKAQAVMASILPHMSVRRTERIKSLIDRFKARPGRWRVRKTPAYLSKMRKLSK